jgi:hypothetical protein
MFFHTAREEQVEKIFGITTGFGVTLLNRSHPLPRLVEMEEKCHGALLANTTHGALYRTLASISPEPNALAKQIQFWVAPVLVTAVVAVILSREDSAPLAYIAGSLGTLIGADLTNLDKVRGLGAPVASIGGAGTFDGIFLTGILAVLLASLYARPRAAHVG